MGMFHANGAYAMSAATTQAAGATTSRRALRYPLAVPVEVTILRSGIPCSIPGRTLNLGPYGLGLDLAGEVHSGDAVGLEFRLSDLGDALQAKAVVRHQEVLRCGLEFLSASPELQLVIWGWAREKSQARAISQLPATASEFSAKEQRRGFRRALWAALIIFIGIGGLGWWQWYRAWNELESGIQSHRPQTHSPQLQASRTQVPADVMESFILHKTEPIYPEDAKQAKVQGVVLLDTVIGVDGSVVELHPVSGPDALAPAAVDAVKWWRFQPYQVNGRPVPVETTIAVEFRGN
jgi:TonB family protein